MELKQFKDVEDIVFQVLKECPETRDNPKKLCLEVWERQGLHLTPQQRFFFLKCYSSESIVRAGRLWQNDRSLFKPQNPQKDLFMENQYHNHYSKG